MQKPLISVIIPCYNADTFLSVAVESVLQQSYQNLEIILINDGSTDNSPQIMEFYLSDERIIIIENEQNIGLIATLNKGIDLAKGTFIARMDADDLSSPERLEKQWAFFEQNPQLSLLSTACYRIDEKSQIVILESAKAKTAAGIYFASFFTQPIVHGSVMAKASVLKANLYSSAALHCEDYELWTRLLKQGERLQTLDEPLYFFRQHNKGVSHTFEQTQIDSFMSLAGKHIEGYFEIKLDEKKRSILLNRINFPVRVIEIEEVFQLIDQLKTIFIQKQQVKEKEVLEDLEKIIVEQKIEILIQAYKKQVLRHIPAYGLFVLKNFKVICSKPSSRFLLQKVQTYFKKKFFN
jgi:glycosyltransferase involved in cell wall biosynthesis